ncbi:unnamed protein product [Brassicogethes aeneus]|uniref:Aminoacyl-transfer RNA synthetases class-II family profile domain-containing protein n=1 Tax=Brassicogethes aeneus TaxID=1431903 RepID=A0A9P0FHS5_BRAAE|nr:unnamed protein product [Brassicogethes aeneus]
MYFKTQEETVTTLLSNIGPISYKSFPLRLYQITSKFRDEIKPRFGLMRAREFIMKDLYSFDVDLKSAQETYSELNDSYDRIFRNIGLDYVKVLGTSGNIGGSISHEFHYQADIGEDKILTCSECGYSANTELSGDCSCPKCKSKNINISSGIEIAHTFLLGDKYSKPLKATFLNIKGKPEVLQMGCFGIGISRIMAAAVEVMSLEQEIRWPDAIAPFNVIILPPKFGSKEEQSTKNLSEKLYTAIENLPNLKDNILIDDRISLTIGRRFLEAKRIGYRFIIVIGKTSTENVPLFELNDLKLNIQMHLTESELLCYIKDNLIF